MYIYIYMYTYIYIYIYIYVYLCVTYTRADKKATHRQTHKNQPWVVGAKISLEADPSRGTNLNSPVLHPNAVYELALRMQHVAAGGE